MSEGLLEQDRDSGKYHLGVALFRLGALVRRRMDVSNEARPYLYELREKINESVHLAILDGAEIMYVYNLESTHAIRMRSDIGVRKPVHCTAEGQAILAFQPGEAIERVIAAGLAPRTPKTITSPEKFIKALGAVRQRGCAIEDEESEPGMVCVAAPIRDDSGAVVAAVGIAGPATRLTKKSIASVMPNVIATAEQVSARLGFRGGAGVGRYATSCALDASIPGAAGLQACFEMTPRRSARGLRSAGRIYARSAASISSM